MLLHRRFVFAMCVAVVVASSARAALVVDFDPNVMSTMFKDGNTTGGTMPVIAVGDLVGWITDVRSPTPGGASGTFDTWVDAQQAAAAATLANSPGGTVLSFPANGNLLVFDANTNPKLDGVLTALDKNTLTLLMVGQANTDTGVKSLIDLGTTTPTVANHLFGLRYDNTTKKLEGMVQGTAAVSLSLMQGDLFVSSLVWNGPGTTATLTVTTLNGTTTSSNAANSAAIDMQRFRIGKRVDNNSGTSFKGLIGDILLYNDVDDHQSIFDSLVQSYLVSVPEASGALFCSMAGCVALVTVSIKKMTGRSSKSPLP